MSIAFVCVVLVATGIRLLLVYVSNKLTFAIGHDIGVKLYHVMLHQPYAFHISQNTSEVLGNLNKVQIVVGGSCGLSLRASSPLSCRSPFSSR